METLVILRMSSTFTGIFILSFVLFVITHVIFTLGFCTKLTQIYHEYKGWTILWLVNIFGSGESSEDDYFILLNIPIFGWRAFYETISNAPVIKYSWIISVLSLIISVLSFLLG